MSGKEKQAAHVAVLERLSDACLSRRLTPAECGEFHAAIAAMKQQGEWEATARDLLLRLEAASPPNVLVQQLSILGDMAALLRCMFPTAPTEASR